MKYSFEFFIGKVYKKRNSQKGGYQIF